MFIPMLYRFIRVSSVTRKKTSPYEEGEVFQMQL